MDTPPPEEIFQLIDKDDRKAVASILKSKVNPNEIYNQHNITPLAYAMISQRSIIASSLITFKADPCAIFRPDTIPPATDSEGTSHSHQESIQSLLNPHPNQKGRGSDEGDGDGKRIPLSLTYGEPNSLVTAMVEPPKVTSDDDGYEALQSPLPFLAIEQANLNLLELFLYDVPSWDVNTIIHMQNKDGQGLIEFAAVGGDSMMLQPILAFISQNESSIDYTRPLPNISPQHRVEVSMPNIDLTGTHLLIQSDYIAVLSTLLLPYAIRNGNQQVASTLLQNKADPDIRVTGRMFSDLITFKRFTSPVSPRSQPPLPPRRSANPLIHLLPLSIEAEYDDIALELIRHDADVNSKNPQGHCCLRLSLMNGKHEILQALLQAPSINPSSLDVYLSHIVAPHIDIEQLHRLLHAYATETDTKETPHSKSRLKKSFKKFLKTFTKDSSESSHVHDQSSSHGTAAGASTSSITTSASMSSSSKLPHTPQKPKRTGSHATGKLTSYGVNVLDVSSPLIIPQSKQVQPHAHGTPLVKPPTAAHSSSQSLPSTNPNPPAPPPKIPRKVSMPSLHGSDPTTVTPSRPIPTPSTNAKPGYTPADSSSTTTTPSQHPTHSRLSIDVSTTSSHGTAPLPPVSTTPKAPPLNVMHPDISIPDDVQSLSHLVFGATPSPSPKFSRLRGLYLDGLILAFSEMDDLVVVELLITFGAYINSRHYFTNDRPIHHAIANLNLPMVRCLLDAKASVVFSHQAGSQDLLTLSRCIREDHRYQIASLIQAQSAFAEHCIQKYLSDKEKDKEEKKQDKGSGGVVEGTAMSGDGGGKASTKPLPKPSQNKYTLSHTLSDSSDTSDRSGNCIDAPSPANPFTICIPTSNIHRQQTLGAMLDSHDIQLDRVTSMSSNSSNSTTSEVSASSFIHLATVPAIPPRKAKGLFHRDSDHGKGQQAEDIDNTPLLSQASQHRHQETVQLIQDPTPLPPFLSALNNHRSIQILLDWSADDYDDEMDYDILFDNPSDGDGDNNVIILAGKAERGGDGGEGNPLQFSGGDRRSTSSLSGGHLSSPDVLTSHSTLARNSPKSRDDGKSSSSTRVSALDPQYSLTTSTSGLYQIYNSPPPTSSSSAGSSSPPSSIQKEIVSEGEIRGNKDDDDGDAMVNHHHGGGAGVAGDPTTINKLRIEPYWSGHTNNDGGDAFTVNEKSTLCTGHAHPHGSNPSDGILPSVSSSYHNSISVEPSPAIRRDHGIIVSSKTLYYLYDEFTQATASAGTTASQYFQQIYSTPTFTVSNAITAYFSKLVFHSLHSQVDIQFGLCPDQLLQFYIAYYTNKLHHPPPDEPRLTIDSSLSFLVLDPLLYHMLQQISTINEIVSILKFFVNNLSLSSSHPPSVLLYDIFRTTRGVLEQEEVRRRQRLLLCQELKEYTEDEPHQDNAGGRPAPTPRNDRGGDPTRQKLKQKHKQKHQQSPKVTTNSMDANGGQDTNTVAITGALGEPESANDEDSEDDDSDFQQYETDPWLTALHTQVDFTPRHRGYVSFVLPKPYSPSMASHHLPPAASGGNDEVAGDASTSGRLSVASSNTLESIINLNSFLSSNSNPNSNTSSNPSTHPSQASTSNTPLPRSTTINTSLSNHVFSAHTNDQPHQPSSLRPRGQSILRRPDTSVLLPSLLPSQSSITSHGHSSYFDAMDSLSSHHPSSHFNGQDSAVLPHDRSNVGRRGSIRSSSGLIRGDSSSVSQLSRQMSGIGDPWSSHNPFSSRRIDAAGHIQSLLETTSRQNLSESDKFKTALKHKKNLDGDFIPSGRAKSLAHQFQSIIDNTALEVSSVKDKLSPRGTPAGKPQTTSTANVNARPPSDTQASSLQLQPSARSTSNQPATVGSDTPSHPSLFKPRSLDTSSMPLSSSPPILERCQTFDAGSPSESSSVTTTATISASTSRHTPHSPSQPCTPSTLGVLSNDYHRFDSDALSDVSSLSIPSISDSSASSSMDDLPPMPTFVPPSISPEPSPRREDHRMGEEMPSFHLAVKGLSIEIEIDIGDDGDDNDDGDDGDGNRAGGPTTDATPRDSEAHLQTSTPTPTPKEPYLGPRRVRWIDQL